MKTIVVLVLLTAVPVTGCATVGEGIDPTTPTRPMVDPSVRKAELATSARLGYCYGRVDTTVHMTSVAKITGPIECATIRQHPVSEYCRLVRRSSRHAPEGWALLTDMALPDMAYYRVMGKVYEGDATRQWVRDQELEPVVSPKASRTPLAL